MITNLIVLFVIFFAFYFVFKYRLLGFTGFFILIGSRTDSSGIFHYISKYIPYYSGIINIIVLLVLCYSLAIIFLNDWESKNKMSKSMIKWVFIPLFVLMVLMFFSQLLKGYGIYTSFDTIVTMGIPFFFIYYAGILRAENKNMLFQVVIIQAVLIIIIFFLKGITSEINGVTYWDMISNGQVSRDYIYSVLNAKISFFNFDKYSTNVSKFAQFHNPNSLGAYSTIMIVLGSHHLWDKSALFSKIVGGVLTTVGILAWFNSLTKGPMLGLLMAVILCLICYLGRDKTFVAIFILLFIMTIFILSIPLMLKFFDYVIPNSTDSSVLSRYGGYQEALRSIIHHPFVGIRIDQVNDRAHILFLKIATNYGLIAGIISLIPFIYAIFRSMNFYIRYFFSIKMQKLFLILGLLGIIFGSVLTNGVIVYVIFWGIFAEAFYHMDTYKAHLGCDQND